MANKKFPNLESFHTIVLDFDGVFTDNKVYLNQDGIETIVCNKADSLGINIIQKFIIKKKLNIDIFVLSKESNPVVSLRCKKMGLKCYNGVNNKFSFLKKYISEKKSEYKDELYKGIVYLGNDLNDLELMQKCGFSFAPKDAHEIIKNIAKQVLDRKGGNGFVREFVETFISLQELIKKDPNFLMELLS